MLTRISEAHSLREAVTSIFLLLSPVFAASAMTTLIFVLNRAVAHKQFSLIKTLLSFCSNLFLATMVFLLSSEFGLSPLGANGLSCLALFMGHDWIRDIIDNKVKELSLINLLRSRRRPPRDVPPEGETQEGDGNNDNGRTENKTI